MSGPLPLIESSENAHARALLRAARADGPARSSAQRTLLALGVGVGLTTTAGLASGSGTGSAAAAKASTGLGAWGASASLPAIAAKWLLIGSVGGVALASGAAFVSSSAVPEAESGSTVVAEAPKPSDKRAERPAEQELLVGTPEQLLNAEPVEQIRGAASAAPDKPSAAPQLAPSQAAFAAPEQSKVLRDVALLDRARNALRAGDLARALSELDRYDAERETHILDREAQLLRIDALVRRGEGARAAQLAKAYLAAFPNDSHTTRLRALAGTP